MGIFKYRNLALASAIFLVLLLLSFYFNPFVKIAIIVLVVLIFLPLLLFALKGNENCFSLILRYSPSLILVSLAMILSLIFFDKSHITKYCDNEPHEIQATITDVYYQNENFGTYKATLSRVDTDSINEDINITIDRPLLKVNDVIFSTGTFQPLEHSFVEFDEASYYLSYGITVSFEGDECYIVGYESSGILQGLKDINSFLDNRFSKTNDENTHGILSAIFLGNKTHLDKSIQRDFSRIGLSHFLALSGMHISIIVAFLGYALYPLFLPRIVKEVILILSTLFFVGLTGFSESAARAGFMVCLAYTLFFFGNRLNLTSALFYSVTIICILNPYSVFSLSLQLSFVAMLGCIFSSKLIHRIRFLRRIRSKILRFIISTFISSLCVSLFILPFNAIFFGNIALLSPISIVLFSLPFTVLVYLAPVFLLVADIPFVSVAIGWLCKTISTSIISIANQMASVDNIVLPINNTVQFIGIAGASISVLCILILGKKTLKLAKIGCFVSIFVFVVGSVFLYTRRYNNIYASSHSFRKNDLVCIEDMGTITMIEITNTSGSVANSSNSFASYLGYYEIDNYVITNYTKSTIDCVDKLSKLTFLKRLYLPQPNNPDEEEAFLLISILAGGKNIDVRIYNNTVKTENTTISFAKRTSYKATVFSVEYSNTRFSYLSSGAFELCDSFVDEAVFLSDVVVFGAHGPKSRVPFSYKAPYLDYCVFLGNSKNFANESFLQEIKAKTTTDTRFCLSP